MAFCFGEDRVCVTANFGDFMARCRRQGLHPGLIVLEGNATRQQQWRHMQTAIEYIECQASETQQQPGSWMVNRVVEVDPDGACTGYPLPDDI
jgi:hypothetical protein